MVLSNNSILKGIKPKLGGWVKFSHYKCIHRNKHTVISTCSANNSILAFNNNIIASATSVTIYSYLKLSMNSAIKVSKGAKVRNRYNQVPDLTQDTNGKVTNSQLETTNESQEVIPFPTGDHKEHINRRAQRHSKHKTRKIIRFTKEVPHWNGQ